MHKAAKLKQLGGSVAVVLPKAILDRFHLAAGDEVHIIETDEGLLVTPFDPDFEDAMAEHERGEREASNGKNGVHGGQENRTKEVRKVAAPADRKARAERRDGRGSSGSPQRAELELKNGRATWAPAD